MIFWVGISIFKEVRSRMEGKDLVFEYRLDGGDWKESSRMIFK